MLLENKIHAIKASGILLVGLGLFLLFYFGLPPLLEANGWNDNLNCDHGKFCIVKPVIMAFRNDQGLQVYEIRGNIIFNATHTFTVDRFFDYEIKMTTSRKDIKEMMFVIDSVDSLDALKDKDPNILIRDARLNGQFINSTYTNGEFYAKGIWSYSKPSTIAMFIIISNENKTVEYVGKTIDLITIQSETELLNAKQNFESEKTNKIVLGLSWVGVALAPLLLGGDLIARVVLRDD